MNPLLLTDFYKIGHVFQYPKGTTKVYSNMTARGSRLKGIDQITFFGLQYFIKVYLVEYFNEHFFGVDSSTIIDDYRRVIKNSLGSDLQSYEHIINLHKLGYLPLEIKALPEGSIVDLKIPVLTITNTLPEFYWLPNFFETLMSASLWQACNSATLAREMFKIIDEAAKETGIDSNFVQWQGHDFSFRGMSSLESAILSGMGHLIYFSGTDTIPAILGLEKYYNADIEKELIGGSVPATEHSVMCSGEKDNELETFRHLITEVYPKGIISIVSDTWDLWKVITEYLPILKTEILARDGKVVIRPDSGNPADIICGKEGNLLDISEQEHKGVVELLWDVFGGTITTEGYKVLDAHIGVIYGDGITLERGKEINNRLKAKGFASQVVFGVGSYTYQYNTRDTFGFAMKATYIEVDGIGRNIFKNPITDSGEKKSAKGLLCVKKIDNKFELLEEVSKKEENEGCLIPVFYNGIVHNDQTLSDIRKLAIT